MSLLTDTKLLTPDEIARVRRVLIYRLGSFGDTVVLLPCLHHIARVFGNADRRMLTNVPVHGKAPAASAVIGDTGLVHGYIRYTVGERNPLALLKVILAVRRFKPDLLLYLAMPRGAAAIERDRRFFRICGIRQIIGLPMGDLARNLPLGDGMWEHEAARLARTIAPLGAIDLGDRRNWDLGLSEEEHAEAGEALKPIAGHPLIACGPGTKMQAKDWGTEKWRGLLDKLARRFPEHGLALLGAEEDHPVAETVSGSWADRRVNVCGALTPRGSAAVLSRAELFLGPDSGPMHVAGALGIPCAIPFASRTRPGMWYPFGSAHRIVWHELPCSNCDIEVCIEHQRRCLSTISVDEMLSAAVAALEAGRRERCPPPAHS